MLRPEAYDFEMKYIPVREMASDFLSRNPLNQISTDDTAEYFLNMIVSYAVLKACKVKELNDATKAHDTL